MWPLYKDNSLPESHCNIYNSNFMCVIFYAYILFSLYHVALQNKHIPVFQLVVLDVQLAVITLPVPQWGAQIVLLVILTTQVFMQAKSAHVCNAT